MNESIIPKDLNEEERKKYIEIMKVFLEENSRTEKGKMGSYCLSGQIYFAYESAKGAYRKVPIRTINDLSELVVR